MERRHSKQRSVKTTVFHIARSPNDNPSQHDHDAHARRHTRTKHSEGYDQSPANAICEWEVEKSRYCLLILGWPGELPNPFRLLLGADESVP